MKQQWQWIPSVVMAVCLTAGLQAVEVGDPQDAVMAEMGEPTGSLRLGDRTFLLYPRGMIAFCDGLATAVELEDEAVFQLRAEQEAERLAAAEALAAEEALRLAEEGEALKDEILTSEQYQKASAGERVHLWRKFRKKYPSVDVAEIYLAEMKRYEREELMERRIREQEQRIAQLEQRIQKVEQPTTRIRIEEPSRVYYPVPYTIRKGHRVYRKNHCPPSQNSVHTVTTTPNTHSGSNTGPIRRGSMTHISSTGGYSYIGSHQKRSVSLVTPGMTVNLPGR